VFPAMPQNRADGGAETPPMVATRRQSAAN